MADLRWKRERALGPCTVWATRPLRGGRETELETGEVIWDCPMGTVLGDDSHGPYPWHVHVEGRRLAGGQARTVGDGKKAVAWAVDELLRWKAMTGRWPGTPIYVPAPWR